MKKTFLFCGLAVCFALALGANLALAEENADINNENANSVEDGEPVLIVPGPEATANVDDSLEGMEITEPVKVPSNWGLLWRRVKEKVSVWLTVDPVKKAEKQLQFAEERIKLAELIAEKSADEQIQAKAQKMIEQANKFMEKIEAKKDKWLTNTDERAQRLIKNLATHQVRREKVFDKLEEKLPEEAAEKVREFREEALKGSQRLLNAISNENIPEEIREHLQAVKDRIETHATEIKEYREERQEIKERMQNGDEGASEELKALNQERIEEIKQNMIERQENRETLKERIRERLKQQNQAGQE